MAYIDALANTDAIALARQIADRRAKSFDCRQEPQTEGATGKSFDVTIDVPTALQRQANATFSRRAPPILVKALAMGRPPRRQ